MFLKTIIILFFILPSQARIKMYIKTASNKQNMFVNCSGFDNKVITDREIILFNVTSDNLKKGLEVELGRAPEDVFLKDPTPYYNLYEKYKWPQIQRHMSIKQATILDVITEEVVLKTVEYVNNSSVPQKCNKSLTENIEFTVYPIWSTEGFPGDDIIIELCIDFSTNVHCFKHKWRESKIENTIQQFGQRNVKGFVNLKPGQTIVSKLIANKTTILVEFQYTSTLIGRVIADYENLYGKYHFWAPTISDVMKAGSLPNEIVTTERIGIRGYTDPKMFMYNKDTGEEIGLFKRIKLS